MKYQTAKSLCVDIPLLILGPGTILFVGNRNGSGLELAFYLTVACLGAWILGKLAWLGLRPIYCFRYIKKDPYTPGKLTTVWEFSERVKLHKGMYVDELIDAARGYIERMEHILALDQDEIIDFCRAAVLLRYIELVDGEVVDPMIETFIKQHQTSIRVLDYYKGE